MSNEPALAPSATNDIPYPPGHPNAPAAEKVEKPAAAAEPTSTPEGTPEPAETPTEAPEPAAEPSEKPAAPEDDDGLPDDTPKGVKAAITRAKNRQRAAEQMLRERTDDNRRLMALLERGQMPPPQQSVKEQAATDPEPQPEAYNGDQNAYGKALFDWSVRRAVSQQMEQQQAVLNARREAEDEAKANAEYAKKAAKVREKYDDFATVAGNPSLFITKQMADVIRASDVGPELHYYLGKNPALAEQIAGMPVARAGFELGRIEGQLRQPAVRAVSSAPPPVKPVSSGSTTIKDRNQMGMEEYAREREADRRAGRE